MTQKQELSQIQRKTLTRAIELLVALQFDFAIRDINGDVYGILKVKQERKKQSKRTHPYGSRSTYVRSKLPQMLPADAVNFDFEDYEPEGLRNSIMGIGRGLWGIGSVTATINKELKHIEVLRIK
jgi:hypothetical protein